MSGDSGTLSIDFLVGFTIFLLAFIWVVSMIPGLLIGLQAHTIDYDAVAYRTGVILVEDPGEPALPYFPWETLTKKDVVRFGLAISKNNPNILSQSKVDRFFCSTVFSYPDDYQQRLIFGDYPYQFNISLTEFGTNETRSVGDTLTGSYGSIRRLVKIKKPSSATINYTYINTSHLIAGDNETTHEFSILINNTRLLKDKVRDPVYQIDPAREQISITITGLNSTLYTDREECFNINLTHIYALDPALARIQLFPDPVIDGVPYKGITTEALYSTLPSFKNNISMTLDPSFIPWSNYPRVYLNLTFELVRDSSAPPSCDDPGSKFLNNSLTSAVEYNYESAIVTQPELVDGVLEVNTGSGYRTPTGPSPIPLDAQFTYTILTGLPTFTVKFTDQSTGSPVEWEWDFTDDGTIDSTLNNPTHDYLAAGTYMVNLTVKDASGASKYIKHTVEFKPPIAGFSGTPLSGNSPLNVLFTDLSTGGAASSWKWEYNKTIGGSWIQFNTTKNPLNTFTDGTYDIRLTVTNIFGSSSWTNSSYITALASHNITATAGSGGIITPSGTVVVPYGASQAFVIAPNVGYHITDVLVDGSSVGAVTSYTFINVLAAHTISASFAIDTYIITASAGSGGTISPSGAVSVSGGASQAFTITKNTGYHITDVLVDGSSVGAITSYTFINVLAAHTISASFAANTREVIFYDNFNTVFTGWTAGGTPGAPTWYTGSCKNGSHSIQLINTDRMTRTIPTTAYSSIIVSSALGANNLEAGESIQAQYNTGAGYTIWAQIIDPGDDNLLHNFNFALPAAADHNAAFQLRYRLYGNANTDYGYVDDVLVTGIPD